MKYPALALLLLCSALSARAQVWTDARDLPLHGKAVEETAFPYSRLPESLSGECRPPVWKRGLNSTGLYVRFRTDSPTLWVRWESLFSNVMNHMSPTGSRGLDLYVLADGRWRFLTAAKPDLDAAVTERKLMANMAPGMREYMLYLSAYDGVASLQVGSEEGHPVLAGEVPSPRTGRPVVMYGTSITQGGCVSRPGMVYTNILGRALDREFVNLGFSGNAFLDLEIARLMASVPDPAAYVLAVVENASVQQFEERGEAFFRILRDAHPDVPVVFVQAVPYADSRCDEKKAADMRSRMDACRRLYDALRKSGEKKVCFVDPGACSSFSDAESSVDGTHLTDLGAMRYAEILLPVLRKILRRAR